MALENFTTNVIILGVENQLMAKLPSLLTMNEILRLDRKTLENLAGESENVQILREELSADVAKLKNGLEQCQEWRRANKSEFITRLDLGTSYFHICSDANLGDLAFPKRTVQVEEHVKLPTDSGIAAAA